MFLALADKYIENLNPILKPDLVIWYDGVQGKTRELTSLLICYYKSSQSESSCAYSLYKSLIL